MPARQPRLCLGSVHNKDRGEDRPGPGGFHLNVEVPTLDPEVEGDGCVFREKTPLASFPRVHVPRCGALPPGPGSEKEVHQFVKRDRWDPRKLSKFTLPS